MQCLQHHTMLLSPEKQPLRLLKQKNLGGGGDHLLHPPASYAYDAVLKIMVITAMYLNTVEQVYTNISIPVASTSHEASAAIADSTSTATLK